MVKPIKQTFIHIFYILTLSLVGCSVDNVITPKIGKISTFNGDITIQTATYVSQSDSYLNYDINGFNILANPKKPNEIIVYQNGKVVALLNNNFQRIFYPNQFNLPMSEFELFTYDIKNHSVTYNSKDIYYSDFGLDGIDMESQKFSDKGSNFTNSEFTGKPITSIDKANIPNKVCKSFIENLACCLSDNKQGYQPYSFKLGQGWLPILTNKKMVDICNAKDFDEIKRKRLQELYP